MTWPEALVASVGVVCVTLLTAGFFGIDIEWTRKKPKERDEA